MALNTLAIDCLLIVLLWRKLTHLMAIDSFFKRHNILKKYLTEKDYNRNENNEEKKSADISHDRADARDDIWRIARSVKCRKKTAYF